MAYISYIDYYGVILAIINQIVDMSKEIIKCRTLYSQLKLKSKTVTLQWIPGHCSMEDKNPDQPGEKMTNHYANLHQINIILLSENSSP